MFSRRYFGRRYWAARYFGDGPDVDAVVVAARRIKTVSAAVRALYEPAVSVRTRVTDVSVAGGRIRTTGATVGIDAPTKRPT